MTTATTKKVFAPINLNEVYREIRDTDGYAFAGQMLNHMEYGSSERNNHLQMMVDNINKTYTELKSHTFKVGHMTRMRLQDMLEDRSVLRFHGTEIEGGREADHKVDEIITMMIDQGFVIK